MRRISQEATKREWTKGSNSIMGTQLRKAGTRHAQYDHKTKMAVVWRSAFTIIWYLCVVLEDKICCTSFLWRYLGTLEEYLSIKNLLDFRFVYTQLAGRWGNDKMTSTLAAIFETRSIRLILVPPDKIITSSISGNFILSKQLNNKLK